MERSRDRNRPAIAAWGEGSEAGRSLVPAPAVNAEIKGLLFTQEMRAPEVINLAPGQSHKIGSRNCSRSTPAKPLASSAFAAAPAVLRPTHSTTGAPVCGSPQIAAARSTNLSFSA
jgi:hypothetical protein